MSNPSGGVHRFGGDWTTKKLAAVAKYLAAYSTALKNTSFKKGYIDAFAGTGYRTARVEKHQANQAQLAFPDLAQPEPQRLLDGSARLALKTEPRFDKYIFIERDPERCEQLQALKREFPDLAEDIDVRRGDANDEIKALCSVSWSHHRAVLFLDPYGMQVDWETIEAVAATRAIDLWILFPLGIGVNRLLPRSGDVPGPWRKRLDQLLGSTDWYEALYEVRVTPDLFDDEQKTLVKATTERIGAYFLERLREVFPAVAAHPGVLRNSTNCPLYLLCFAAGTQSKAGQRIALRIADHILKGIQ